MKIKFLTINIWSGGKLFNELVSFIREIDPDIITMQEVYNGKDLSLEKQYRSVDILKEKLNYPYVAFHPSFIDIKSFGNVEQGNAIFTKFPIQNSEAIFFDVPFGTFNDGEATSWEYEPMNMVEATIEMQDKLLHVFNVHGIWGLDGKDNKRRIAMSETIINQIKDKQHVVLAGDFNVQPNTQTIHNIEKHLTNVFKNELPSTFNMKRKRDGGYATAVVDMIFVSSEFQLVDHYCPQVDISDHLPLVCALRV